MAQPERREARALERQRRQAPYLTGCAIAVVALGAGCYIPSTANAASSPTTPTAFKGTFNPVNGGATITSTPNGIGGVTDRIEITRDTVVINWTPNDQATGTGAINFLGVNDQGIFNRNGASYTVLNRIIPTGDATGRSIALNGTVTSTINNETPGGNVWFYTPNGLLIGATAKFQVGGLVLTTADHPFDPATGTISFGAGGSLQFGVGSTTVGKSSVSISSGAQIEALAANSYVAVISPKIVQSGTVKVDGSAAYIAAESATIAMNNGLFAINVIQGTTDTVGIEHTGTTTGPASTGSTDGQAIYMVAIPKNDALTMLIGGSIGYEAASNASVSNGVVVLSAGYDPRKDAGRNGGTGNITLTGGSFSSDVSARTSGRITGNFETASLTTGTTGNLNLSGDEGVSLSASGKGSISIGGDLTLTSETPSASGNIVKTADVSLSVSKGGTVSIGGLSASTATRNNNPQANDQEPNAVSGNVAISVAGSGSTLNVGSNTVLSASAEGSANYKGLNGNGNAQGGTVAISVSDNGSATLGFVEVDASAVGFAKFQPSGVELQDTGGSASAGTVSITVTSGSSLVAKSLIADASATGGSGKNGSDAFGGTVTIKADGGSIKLNDSKSPSTAVTSIVTTGLGGFAESGGKAGQGVGGTILLEASANSSITLGNGNFNSKGTNLADGEGLFGAGQGGFGKGGSVTLNVNSGGQVIANLLTLASEGLGGNSEAVSAGGNPVLGGDGLGGMVHVNVAGGTLSIANKLEVRSTGTGGFADPGQPPFSNFAGMESGKAGNGTGGNTSVSVTGGSLSAGSIVLTSAGKGGTPGAPGIGPIRAGGTGTGGNANFTVSGTGTLTTDNLIVKATGAGGSENDFFAGMGTGDALSGGTGIGGSAKLSLLGGTANLKTVAISAAGNGGTANGDNLLAGTGGAGIGGAAALLLSGGNTGFTNVSVSAVGSGGKGGTSGTFSGNGVQPGLGAGGQGGSGTGGAATVTLDVDPSIASLTIDASGSGGAGGNGIVGGAGGAGIAGDGVNGALLSILAGSLTVTGATDILANGTGGDGGTGTAGAGGRGGDGAGGSARLTVSGATSQLFAGALTMTGFGGGGEAGTSSAAGSKQVNGASGGNATGGLVSITVDAGGRVEASNTVLNANADGAEASAGIDGVAPGNGGNGGSAVGGRVELSAAGGVFLANGTSFVASANAVGGLGGNAGKTPSSPASSGKAGSGGNATSGSAQLGLSFNNAKLDLLVSTSATGANAGTSISNGGSGGNALAAPVGGASLTVLGTGNIAASVAVVSESKSGAGVTPGMSISGDTSVSLGAGSVADFGKLSIRSFADGIIPGGSAKAGSAILSVANGKLVSGATMVTSGAIAGNGGTGLSGTPVAGAENGGNGSNGGAATTGFASISVVGADSDVRLSDVFVATNARGGQGGDGGAGNSDSSGKGGNGGNGGAGGIAQAGTAEIVNSGGKLTISNTTTGDFGLFADSVSGAGGYAGQGNLGGKQGMGGPSAKATGGTVQIISSGGTLTLPDFQLSAVGIGGDPIEGAGAAGHGALGQGGKATIELTNSAVFSAGAVKINVNGNGGQGGVGTSGFLNGSDGGQGIGGQIALIVQGNASANFKGNINLDANGIGGFGGTGANNNIGTSGNGGDAGDAVGGRITLDNGSRSGSPGFIAIGSGLIAAANATAGKGGDAGLSVSLRGDGGNGGNAEMGTIEIALDDINNSALKLSTNATGGNGGEGSKGGNGGSAAATRFSSAGLTLRNIEASATDIAISADSRGGVGGIGIKGMGGNGGLATAGRATLALQGQSEVSVTSIAITANASGGNGMNGGSGGAATGGTAAITAINSILRVDAVNKVSAMANGGNGGVGIAGMNVAGLRDGGSGGSGGKATGGNALISVNGLSASLEVKVFQGFDSRAFAGAGGAGGAGFNDSGGGVGGNGGIGGNATGGQSAIDIASGTAKIIAGNPDDSVIRLFASATGGRGGAAGAGGDGQDDGNSAASGNGAGGSTRISLTSGARLSGGDFALLASGTGGQAPDQDDFDASRSGDGVGGQAFFNIDASSLLIKSASIFANGYGGSSARNGNGNGNGGSGSLVRRMRNGSRGGNGKGGSASIILGGSGLSLDPAATYVLSARGVGGDGGIGGDLANGGDGGSGVGGSAFLDVPGVPGFDPQIASIVLDTSGIGGKGADGVVGGAGGAGIGGGGGGSASSGSVVDWAGEPLTIALVDLKSNGTGGAGGKGSAGVGGAGGAGTGGIAQISADGVATQLSALKLSIASDAFGGAGGSSGAGLGGGAGGAATGGESVIRVSNDATLSILAIRSFSSNATGGAGGNGGSAISAATAGGIGGTGGQATGGTANVDANSATLKLNGLSATANAVGGAGGAGGNGANGSLVTGVAANGSTGANGLTPGANGAPGTNGANGTNGNAGSAAGGGGMAGDATGGIVRVSASNASLTTGAISAVVDATGGLGGKGGNGGNGSNGLAGGNGGDGGNGADGAAGTQPIPPVIMNGVTIQPGVPGTAGGKGGNGGNGGSGGNGGVGGDGGSGGNAGFSGFGFGGQVQIDSVGSSSKISTGAITVSTNGIGGGLAFGGQGGSGGAQGAGGNGGTGGSFGNGGIGTPNGANGAAGAAGAAGVGGTTGGAFGTGGFSTVSNGVGGSVFIRAIADGKIEVGGDAIIEAAGLSGFNDPVGSGGTVTISAQGDGNGKINFGNLQITTRGQFGTLNRDGVTISAENTTISIDQATINSANDIAFEADGTGQVSVANDLFAVGSSFFLTHSNQSDPLTPTVKAKTITFNARVDYTAADGSLVSTTDSLFIDAGGNLSTSALSAANDIRLTAGGSLSGINALVAGDDIVIRAGAALNLATLKTTGLGTDNESRTEAMGSHISVDGQDTAAVTISTVDAHSSLAVRGASISGTDWTAGEDILASAVGLVSLGSVSAGDDLTLVGASIKLGSGTARGDGPDSHSVSINPDGIFFFDSEGRDGANIGLSALSGPIDSGDLNASASVSASGAGLNLADVDAGTSLSLTSFKGGDIQTGRLTSGDNASITSAGSLKTTDIKSQTGGIFITAQSGITTGNISALQTGVSLSNGDGTIQTGFISVHDGFNLKTTSLLKLLGVTTLTGDIAISSSASGTNTLGDLTADTAGGDITAEAGALNLGNIKAGATTELTATTGNLVTGNLQAGAGIALTSASALSTGNITARAGDISLTAGSTIVTGNHDAQAGSVRLENTSGTITAGQIALLSDFTLLTKSNLVLTGVTAGDDIRITTSGSADIGTLVTNGTGFDNEGAGSDIALETSGFLKVSHASSAGDFVASTGSFETGLNTIIAAGDIEIDSMGDALLGNSQAGGQIRVNAGGAIVFGGLSSGAETSLNAGSTVAGNQSNAGGQFFASGSNLDIGSVQSSGGAAAQASFGDLVVGSVTTNGNIALDSFGSGMVTSNLLDAGGNIRIDAQGSVSIGLAKAAGTFVDLDNFASDGTVFIISKNGVTLTDAAVKSSIGISGTQVTSTGLLNAGEDVLVLSSGSAKLNTVSAGDNIKVVALGGITIANGIARGDGRDDREVTLDTPTFVPIDVITFTTGMESAFFNLASAANDGADVSLSTSGALLAGQLKAGDDLFIDGGAVTVSGLAQTLGTGAIGGSSDIIINATSISLTDNKAFNNLLANGSGNVTLGTASAGGKIAATSSAGSIGFTALTAGTSATIKAATNVIGGRADTGTSLSIMGSELVTGDAVAGGALAYTASAGSVTSGTLQGSSIAISAANQASTGKLTATSGNVAVTATNGIATGAVSAASGNSMLTASKGGISAGTVAVLNDLTTNAGSTTKLDSITAGDDIRITSGGAVALASLTTTKTGTDGEADGRNIVIAGGSVDFAALKSIDQTQIKASGNVTGGTVNAGTSLSIMGGEIATGDAVAGGALAYTASAASVTSGTLQGSSIAISAANQASTGKLTATSGNVAVTATNGIATGAVSAASGSAMLTASKGGISAGTVAVLTDLTTNAGSTTKLDSVTAGDDIRITSGGAVALANLTTTTSGTDGEADGRNIVIAGGSVDFAALKSVDQTQIKASGNVTGGTVNAGTSLSIMGGEIATGDAVAGGALAYTASAGSVTSGTLQGSSIAISATNQANIGKLTATSGNVAVTATNGILTGAVSSASGSATLTASKGGISAGTVAVLNDLTTNAGTTTKLDAVTAGDDIRITSGGAVALTSLTTTKTGSDGEVDGRNIIVSAGTVSLGDAASEARIVLAASTGNLTFGSLKATSDVSLMASNGQINGAGATATGGNIQANGQSLAITNLAASGSIGLVTNGFTQLTSTKAGGAFTLSANGTNLGRIGAASIDINSGLGVIFDQLVSAGVTRLVAGDDVAGNLINSAGMLSVMAGRNINAMSVTAGPTSLTAAGSTQLGTLTTSGNTGVSSNTGINITRTNIGGTLGLTAINGTVLVSTDLAATGAVTATGQSIGITALGNLNITAANASSGSIMIGTAGDLLVGSANAANGSVALNGRAISLTGNINAGQTLTAAANGLLTINASAIGAAVDLRSSDIAIGSNAQIGAIGRTSDITLTNSGGLTSHIGGNGGSGTYGLSNGEAQRLFANNLTFAQQRAANTPGTQFPTVLNSAAPDLILDTLSLTAANGQTGATAANIGTSGRLRIQTSGKVRTIGSVTLANVGSANRLEIAATQAIEVDPARGSIALRTANGALGGTLALSSETVVAASSSAITDIIAAPTVSAISDRLSRNDGATNDTGVFSADAITITVRDHLYIQNTGLTPANTRTGFDNRRGFTVGTGGLQILAGGPSTRIVINGRQSDGTGGFITGLRLIPQVRISGQSTAGVGQFDLDSTINGCSIVNPASCQVSFDQLGITRDTINSAREKEDESDNRDILPFGLIQLMDVEQQGYPPVLDDPVTGAGNDDLWSVDDEESGDPSSQ